MGQKYYISQSCVNSAKLKNHADTELWVMTEHQNGGGAAVMVLDIGLSIAHTSRFDANRPSALRMFFCFSHQSVETLETVVCVKLPGDQPLLKYNPLQTVWNHHT